jgi:hypothetical protein
VDILHCCLRWLAAAFAYNVVWLLNGLRFKISARFFKTLTEILLAGIHSGKVLAPLRRGFPPHGTLLMPLLRTVRCVVNAETGCSPQPDSTSTLGFSDFAHLCSYRWLASVPTSCGQHFPDQVLAPTRSDGDCSSLRRAADAGFASSSSTGARWPATPTRFAAVRLTQSPPASC